MNDKIKNILENGENIVWEGRIYKKIIHLFMLFSFMALGVVSIFIYKFEGPDFSMHLQGVDPKYVGVLLLIIGTVLLLYLYISLTVIGYFITQKRIIIKSGIIGKDYKTIYFDQVKDITVDVGLIGKIFNIGVIKIDTGKTKTINIKSSGRSHVKTVALYDYFRWIVSPYDVFKLLQQSLSKRKESLYGGRT